MMNDSDDILEDEFDEGLGDIEVTLENNALVVREDERVIVTFGPSVWIGQKGTIVRDDGEFVVVQIAGEDDARGGKTFYDVRMPAVCVETFGK